MRLPTLPLVLCVALAAAEPPEAAALALTEALLVLDWAQSRNLTWVRYEGPYAVRTTYTARETNPILGPRPSRRAVNCYFTSVLIAVPLITMALPPRYRPLFLGTVITLEVLCTSQNRALGLKARF